MSSVGMYGGGDGGGVGGGVGGGDGEAHRAILSID